MDDKRFDDIEKFYQKAVLKGNNKKKVKRKKTRYSSFDRHEHTVILFSLVMLIAVIVLSIKLIKNFTKVKLYVNKKLVDKVEYEEKAVIKENAIDTQLAKLRKTEGTEIEVEKSNSDALDLTNIDTVVTGSTNDKNKINVTVKNDSNLGSDISVKTNEDVDISKLARYYTIQVLTSKDESETNKAVDKIKEKGYDAFIRKNGKLFRIFIDKKFASRESAVSYKEQLVAEKIIPSKSWVRPITNK